MKRPTSNDLKLYIAVILTIVCVLTPCTLGVLMNHSLAGFTFSSVLLFTIALVHSCGKDDGCTQGWNEAYDANKPSEPGRWVFHQDIQPINMRSRT